MPPAHVDALWKGINDGTVDVIGTDHAPHTKEEKEIGWKDMWKSPGGEPQIQDYLSLFLTAVNEGKLTLDTLVRITSYNPARIFGVYPRKGVIQPGADADMVIVDMNKEESSATKRLIPKSAGRRTMAGKLKACRFARYLSGKTVMEDGKIVGKPGDGQFITPLDRREILPAKRVCL